MLTGTGIRESSTTPTLTRLLERRPPTDIQWGLERVSGMLAALSDPHLSYQSIHVAGTNGKGSVASTVAAVLAASGRRVGLYTSPHLVDFSERIRIDGEPASPDLLEVGAGRVLPLAEAADCSFFEATTVLAFDVFGAAGVDLVVAEVGLGGRLDATNVLEPLVSVITGVDLDHADHLGHTLELIAAEKAGIIKPGVPVALGPMPDRLLTVLRARADELAAPAVVLGLDAAVQDVRPVSGGMAFRYRSALVPEGITLWTPLFGMHQAANAGLAVLCLEQTGLVTASDGPVRDGLASVSWPGRFQRLERGGLWVLDMAHNTGAAEALAHALAEADLPRPVVAVVAILGDKPWREMLEPLLRTASAAVFTIAPSSPPERRWNPASAAHAVESFRSEVVPDFGKALHMARELAGDGTVVVTGSAHTVGDALRALSPTPTDASGRGVFRAAPSD